MISTFLILAACGVFAHGYTTFDTSCTIPNTTINYVFSPNTRGTVDIVWSCFGVFVACIYSILHLKIPPRKEHVSAREQRWLHWRRYATTAGQCFIVLIWPELVYTLSMGEWLNARRQLKLLHANVEGTKDDWELPHMFFANAGGFVVLYKQDALVAEPTAETPRPPSKARTESPATLGAARSPAGSTRETSTADLSSADSIRQQEPERNNSIADRDRAVESAGSTTGTGVRTGRSSSRDISSDPGVTKQEHGMQIATPRAEKDGCEATQYTPKTPGSFESQLFTAPSKELLRFHLTALVLRQAIEEKILSSEAPALVEIEDRSKTNIFAKFLVCLQLAGFLVDIVARLVQGMQLAPMEVEATAFALCSICVYPVLMRRPKNIDTPIVLGVYDHIPSRIVELKLQNRDVREDSIIVIDATKKAFPGRPPQHLGLPRLMRKDAIVVCLFYVALSLLFGAIHLAGWNLELPSEADRWLWRSASIAVTFGPSIVALGLGLSDAIRIRPGARFAKATLLVMFALAAWAVGMGRLIFIVEAIRSLFFLTPSAYMTARWPNGIPHFG